MQPHAEHRRTPRPSGLWVHGKTGIGSRFRPRLSASAEHRSQTGQGSNSVPKTLLLSIQFMVEGGNGADADARDPPPSVIRSFRVLQPRVRPRDALRPQGMKKRNAEAFLSRFCQVVFSSRTTAWAAMPEPSPVKPSPSSVVAFTLTCSGSIPRAAARFSAIWGR